MITTKQLKEWFDYDGTNLVWKINRGQAKIGQIAGTINSRGYRHIRLFDKFYQAHRLVWIWHGFELNDILVIDHINRNKLDNRLENLRQVTLVTNANNRVFKETRGTRKVGNKFVATARVNSKRVYIGRFPSQEKAIEAREAYLKDL